MRSSHPALILGGRGTVKPFPPIVRPPLPPPPQPVDYATTLPFTPPTGRDLYFNRGQFCGISVKGAPVVPGSNASNPDLVMAALLDNYPEWVQEEFFRIYCGYGLTHLQRSLAHALYYNNNLAAFIRLCQKAQGYGLFSDVWFIANEFPGFQFNQDVSFWKPKLDPYIDALLGNGCIDQACPSWQMDQVMMEAPGNATISIIKYVADRMPKTVPVYTHWMNGAMAWWKTGGELWVDEHQSIWIENRFDWWRAMAPYLTGAHHQGNTDMPLKEYQDRICDTLDYFGGRTDKGNMGQSLRTGTPKNYILNVYEYAAQRIFDGDMTEEQGAQRGFYLVCTTSPWAHVGGYGNDGCYPDGSRL